MFQLTQVKAMLRQSAWNLSDIAFPCVSMNILAYTVPTNLLEYPNVPFLWEDNYCSANTSAIIHLSTFLRTIIYSIVVMGVDPILGAPHGAI